MGQKKLLRFNAIASFPNVLQYPEGMAGNWKDFFHNENPITLELACGKGEYSVNLGREHRDRNFIGVDLKGNRMYIGAKQALDESLPNVAFLRTQILRITDYFREGEIDTIWIIFPDPFLRESKAKKRLTHPRFLRLYQQILKPGGLIQLKTDSEELYKFTLEVIREQGCTLHENISDVYGQGKDTGALAIRTHYENMHLAEGRTIRLLSFSLPAEEIKIPEKKSIAGETDLESE